LNQHLRLRVHGTGRFIEDENDQRPAPGQRIAVGAALGTKWILSPGLLLDSRRATSR
jgi:hypothetical protein